MKNVSDGDATINSKKAIYDIGTEILFLHCFATTDMFLFCKKLIFSGIATHWPVDKDSGVKTPFWAIIKKTQKIDKGSNGSKNWQRQSRFWKRFRQPFVDLINSKDCINVCDLLYLTDRQKVAKTFFKNTMYYKNKNENVHATLDCEVEKSGKWKRVKPPFVDLSNSKRHINLYNLLHLTDRRKVA